ncbi:DeoR/GlpR family DNA-binding transcription regulator [Spongorhabdus nitratireducens]
MGQQTRQEAILKYVTECGFVSIDDLAQRFHVTPQTIRRDIQHLADEQKLKRLHGGVQALQTSTVNTAYRTRQQWQRQEKHLIAQTVARNIPDHCSLFLNIGTTTEAIARELQHHKGLRIITNNMNVAAILSEKDDFSILIAGGNVRNDGGIVGQSTSHFIEQFRTDFAITGVSGIALDGALLDFDYQEVLVTRTMLAQAQTRLLAADYSKFGRNALVQLGSLSSIDQLYTDQTPPDEIVELAKGSIDIITPASA